MTTHPEQDTPMTTPDPTRASQVAHDWADGGKTGRDTPDPLQDGSGEERAADPLLVPVTPDSPQEAIDAAKSHVFHAITRWRMAASDDAVVQVMARNELIADVVAFAAPAIRAAERERIRATLRQHYLANIACDHLRKEDNPWCACSLVNLGWHPSVGAAVEAWITHALGATDA